MKVQVILQLQKDKQKTIFPYLYFPTQEIEPENVDKLEKDLQCLLERYKMNNK